MYIKTSTAWKKINEAYIKTSVGWKKVTEGYIKTINGWKRFWSSALKPQYSVQIDASTVDPTTYLITLTGTNYYWSPGPPSLTYYFEWSTNGGTTWSQLSTGTATNPAYGSSNTYTYQIPTNKLSANTVNTYRFRVYATNNPLTGESSATTTIQGPTDITISNSGLDLSWGASTGANRYVVYISTDNVTFTIDGGTTATTYTLSGLSGSTNYYVKVKPITGAANNTGYAGNFSNTLTISTPGALSTVTAYNFTTAGEIQGFFTTGANTTNVKYQYLCSDVPGINTSVLYKATSSNYPYKVQDNLLSLFTLKTWNYDDYNATGGAGTNSYYYSGDLVWYYGNRYQARLQSFSGAAAVPSTSGDNRYWTRGASVGTSPSTSITWNSSSVYSQGSTVTYGTGTNGSLVYSYTAKDPGFLGQIPTNTTYWNVNTVVTYNPGNYVLYNGGYYFNKVSTNGTYPTNTAYWKYDAVAWTMYATPYNGAIPGSTLMGSRNPSISINNYNDLLNAGTLSSSNVTSTGFTLNFTPSVNTNNAYIDIKTGGVSIGVNYPYSQTVTPNTATTHNTLNTLTANTLYTATAQARYMYNATYGVLHNGATTAALNVTTVVVPGNFTYYAYNNSTTPSTPSLSFTRDTINNNNRVYWNWATSKPADTASYVSSWWGTAFDSTSSEASPLSTGTFTTVNNYTYNSSATYEDYEVGFQNGTYSGKVIAYGSGSPKVGITWTSSTNAGSFVINYTISGASNGNGTYSSGVLNTTDAIGGWNNNFTSPLYEITPASGGTITVNSITAYSNSDGTGGSKSGTVTSGQTNVITPTQKTASSGVVSTSFTALPSSLQSFTATPGNGQVTLNFTASSSGTTSGYYYSYSTGATEPASSSWSSTTAVSVTISSLTNGTAYNFWARPYNGVGYGSASTASATPVAPNLTAPTPSSASGSAGNVNVYFSGGSGPNYQVYWSSSNTVPTTTSYDANGSSSPITVTNMVSPIKDTVYYFSVRSVSTLTTTGSGPSSTISSWSGSRVSITGGTKPTFSATTPIQGGFSGSVTNYDSNYIYSGSASGTGVFQWGTASGSSYPFTVTGLSNGASSTVTVTASRSGYITDSATVSGTATPKITKVVQQGGGSTTPYMSWTITAINTASVFATLYRGTTTPPTTTATTTVNNLFISTGAGGLNWYYYAAMTPYPQTGGLGTPGTQITTSILRNTSSTATSTNNY